MSSFAGVASVVALLVAAVLPLRAGDARVASPSSTDVRSFERVQSAANGPGLQWKMQAAPYRSVDPPERPLTVTWPLVFADPLVLELGEQRIVLRPVGAYSAPPRPLGNRLIYSNGWFDVDVTDTPGASRFERQLTLRSPGAPRSFGLEILDMIGVADVISDNGAIRFVPIPEEHRDGRRGGFLSIPPRLELTPPVLVDRNGQRLTNQASWEREGQILRVTVTGDDLQFPVTVIMSFSLPSAMGTSRTNHTSTLLSNGMVLIAGGTSGGVPQSSAELYDPRTGSFSPTGSMSTSRTDHTATMLRNGKVLVTGGTADSIAELYDPQTGVFVTSGSMDASRSKHTSTLLASGEILVVGGSDGPSSLATAEIYDVPSGSFHATGSLGIPRQRATATLLGDGRVLIAGGNDGVSSVATAEIYSPATGTFSPAGSMTASREAHTATLVRDDKVLITAGFNGSYLASAELYDSVTGAFSATSPLERGRSHHTATLLPDGRVLICGGYDGDWLNSTELFSPVAGTFNTTIGMSDPRGAHSATMLDSGRVLMTGGVGLAGDALATTELYEVDANEAFVPHDSGISILRTDHTATPLPDGRVLIAGGTYEGGGNQAISAADLYERNTGRFYPTGSMQRPRMFHTATPLSNGKVLVAGGSGDDFNELFDPATGLFELLDSAQSLVARSHHTATLLMDGRVLMVGGYDHKRGGATGVSEIYDPGTGRFSATGSLSYSRTRHSAALLPDGRVLIIGGESGSGSVRWPEIYDPSSGRFTTIGQASGIYGSNAAVSLDNGDVLLGMSELFDSSAGVFRSVGPSLVNQPVSATEPLSDGRVLFIHQFGYPGEIYDPSTESFRLTASMIVSRRRATATLLWTGEVLVVGGNFPSGGTPALGAELYLPGPSIEEFRRPIISGISSLATDATFLQYAFGRNPGAAGRPATFVTTTDPFVQPRMLLHAVSPTAPLIIRGSEFADGPEASGGATNSSASNYPIIKLRRFDGGPVLYLAPGESWTEESYTSGNPDSLPVGSYYLTISVNGISSTGAVLTVVPRNENGDVDGNGTADVVWWDSTSGKLAVWLMDGATVSALFGPTMTDFDMRIAGLGNFDGILASDILWQNSSGKLLIWFMNGVMIGSQEVVAVVDNPQLYVAAVGDFDGDRKSDILWRREDGPCDVCINVAVWLMDGAHIASGHYLRNASSTMIIQGVGDFDGDGKDDLVWRNSLTGETAMWLMNGSDLKGGFYLPLVSDLSMKVAGVGDVDGDGKADIVWRNVIDGTNAVWLMDGAFLKIGVYLPTVPDTGFFVAGMGDFDGDGYSDILWRNSSSGEMAVWFMSGPEIANSSSLPAAPAPMAVVSPGVLPPR